MEFTEVGELDGVLFSVSDHIARITLEPSAPWQRVDRADDAVVSIRVAPDRRRPRHPVRAGHRRRGQAFLHRR